LVVVSYHDDLKEVQGIWPEGWCGPFDRAEWFATLARECGLKPVYVVARRNRAVAILPLMHGQLGVEALANWYSFVWMPLFSREVDFRNDEHEFLLRTLARDLRRKAWRVSLAPLPGDPGEACPSERAFAAAGWKVSWSLHHLNHYLQIKGRSFADYLATRPGPLRTTLKRKQGKVAVELLDRFDPDAWQAYEEIYAESWKPAEGSPGFLRRFAEAEGAAGRLRMAIARADGQVVAAQFWTVEQGRAYIHKLAHREAASALSPGTTLTAALMEQVIDRDRVGLVDFGTGDDPYKRDWMEEVRPLWRIEALDPAAPRAWPHLLRGLVRRLSKG
jgi:hypothetical protein